MADLWDDEGDASEFALPGDDQLNGLVQEAAEPVAATDTPDQPLVEAEAPGEADEATDEPVETDEPAEELILGKFKTVEDALAAYQQLEQHSGRQANEIGELRRLTDERLAGIEQQIQQPQQQAQVDYDWDELAYERPLDALQIAARSGNPQAYGAARAAVEAVHPGYATLVEQQAATESRLQQLGQQVQETREPVIRNERQAVVTSAYREVSAEFPDFEELTPAMNQIVTELAQSGYDWITPALESGNPDQAKAAWRQLALSARGLRGENLAEVAKTAAREHVAETTRARKEAVVASASTTVTPAPKGFAERVGEQWAEIDKPFSDGWNIS